MYRLIVDSLSNQRLYTLIHDFLNRELVYITFTVLATSAAVIWLQLWINLARKGTIDSKFSRKIIHTGSAPLFIALFPLFSEGASSKYFAAAVPFSQLVRLVISAKSSDEQGTPGLVGAVSRTGEKKEALQGPFYYNIILFLVSLFAFRSSVPGVFVISQMAAGDGMADIIGRRFGSVKWPFMKEKSIAGTIGFIVSAFLVSMALLGLYNYTGCISLNIIDDWPTILLISVICAFVELVPGIDDNISVSAAAYLVSSYFFPT